MMIIKSARAAFIAPAGLVEQVMERTQRRGVLRLEEVLEGQGVDHHGHERHVRLFAVLLQASKAAREKKKQAHDACKKKARRPNTRT